jgi:hypothetical protein
MQVDLTEHRPAGESLGVRVLDRLRVGDENTQILAHGAMAGSMYLVRLEDRLEAWQLPGAVD